MFFFQDLFADGNDFSWETMQQGRNFYYQKQMAEQMTARSRETTSLLTSALNIHLNLGQNLTINTSSVFMSLETISVQSLANKTIQSVGNARIQLPVVLNTSVTNNQSLSLRVCSIRKS